MVLIPQSLAYAQLAGVPPEYGLYCAAVAPIFGALVGSSPYLQTGPVATTSMLTLGALAPLAAVGTDDFAALAALLALVVGAVRLLIGLVHAGVIANLMSQPVIVSFTLAAGGLIVASQIPTVLGVPSAHDSPLTAAGAAFLHPERWDLMSIGVAAGAGAVVMLGRRVSRSFPWVLVAATGGWLVNRSGVVALPDIGPIPVGMPSLMSGAPWQDLPALFLPGVVIAFVGFAEAASVARRYAAEDRKPWNPDREFVGQGLANLGAGLVGGLPAGGSFARSALNKLAGATSRWSGAITGLTVLAVLPFAGVLDSLPMAALSGLVIGAVIPQLDIRPLRECWRCSRPQFAVCMVTFGTTLSFAPRVDLGVLAGVGAALAVHLWRELHCSVAVEHGAGGLVLRPQGVLYFASAPAVAARLMRELAARPDIEEVTVELDQLGRIDYTGALALRDVIHDLADAGVKCAVTGTPPHARVLVDRVFS